MEGIDFDPNFEPQTRARSNTWPRRPQEFLKPGGATPDDGSHTPTTISEEDENSIDAIQHHQLDQVLEQIESETLGIDDSQDLKHEVTNSKTKTTSRRNAWGNLSYADLITKAIQNSPEKRLTLSQIYDWMVHNVPYFKDKGDSNSSAGWKNSIRHNLSLHSRFMRIQNEGTGKSSWWVINPDAKPGKSPRRRATSMDTSKSSVTLRQRDRARKKIAAMKASGSHSPGPDSELLNQDSPYESLSPGEFRPRATSNASSLGGRLSPIPVETDLHDSQVPPMSPIPWNVPGASELSGNYPNGDVYGTEQIGDTLASLMMDPPYSSDNLGMSGNANNGLPSSEWALQGTTFDDQFGDDFGPIPAPPPYPNPVRRSPQNGIMLSQNEITGNMSGNGGSYTLMDISQQNMGQCNNSMYQEQILGQDPMLSAQSLQNPYTGFSTINTTDAYRGTTNVVTTNTRSPLSQAHVSSSQIQQQPSDSLLRAALSQKQPQIMVTTPHGNNGQMMSPQQRQRIIAQRYAAIQARPPTNSFQPIPQQYDDFSLDTLEPDIDLQCDVSEVLRQEISMSGGALDFNFDQFQVPTSSSSTTPGGQNYVH